MLKSRINKILNSILELEDYSYLVIVLASFLHFIFLLVFYYLEIYEMFVFNIFSTLIYIVLSFLYKQSKSKIFYSITYFEVLTHQLVGIYFTGTNSGFDLLLCCLILIQFIFFRLITSLISSIILIFIIFSAYFFNNIELLFSPKYFELSSYADAYLILYPFNMMILITFLLGYGFLVSQIPSRRINDLKEISYKDFLTGLYNRKYLEEIALPKKNKKSIVLAVCDIDNFKSVNDTYGHSVGDIVLKTLALILISKAKKFEQNKVSVTRWGGEEFLMLGEFDNSEQALAFLEEIRLEVSEYIFNNINGKITITIGASTGFLNNNYNDFFAVADKNLYIGKKSGKNKTVINSLS